MLGIAILEASREYEERLIELGVEPKEIDHGKKSADSAEWLSHCLFMISEIKIFLAIPDTDKATRWLCFIQGIVAREGEFCLNELKHHNRRN
jgi:hypothetical protein